MTTTAVPSPAATLVLEKMRAVGGVAFSVDLYKPLGMSQQRVNQALATLLDQGLVRFDHATNHRGQYARRWEIVERKLQSKPMTTVEKAIAARPQLATVWFSSTRA